MGLRRPLHPLVISTGYIYNGPAIFTKIAKIRDDCNSKKTYRIVVDVRGHEYCGIIYNQRPLYRFIRLVAKQAIEVPLKYILPGESQIVATLLHGLRAKCGRYGIELWAIPRSEN